MKQSLLKNDYINFLQEVKDRVNGARVKAALAANREMVILYWEIGEMILKNQMKSGWGSKVIDRLSADLMRAYPDMKGFSIRNLKYMRLFAGSYKNKAIVQQLVAQLPWGHNIIIMDAFKNTGERLWYAEKTIKNGWSRNVLAHQIKSGLYERQAGKKVNNFKNTMPAMHSELADEAVKDTYIFDFLNLTSRAKEKGIEDGLTNHIALFLMELGKGFAYVGRQYHMEIGDEDFYIDLLFYHLKLRCYVAIELKTGVFKPEYAGKMNFYLSALDADLKNKDDNPSIGIILCRDKNRIIAEYALRDLNKPIGVSDYRLSRKIKDGLKEGLPQLKVLEKEIDGYLLKKKKLKGS